MLIVVGIVIWTAAAIAMGKLIGRAIAHRDHETRPKPGHGG